MTAGWRPDLAFQAAFNADPNDSTAVPVWSDLTVRLLQADQVSRGRQYELDQNQASGPQYILDDPDEYLNPANTLSPYSPNVVPYRECLFQGMWPNGGTGNLLNTGAQGVSYDPSFEAYTAGTTPSWITAVGATTPTIGTTTPHAGTKDLTWAVVNGATVQGVSLPIPCIPGRQYTASGYVRQSSGSTQTITVVGVGSGTTTTTTGAYVRLTVTFTATQPSHTLEFVTSGTAVAGTVLLDDIQHEPGGSASAFTTTGPVIYGVWRGYVERWPSTWDFAGFRGRADITGVDAFGPLNKIALWTEYRNSVLAKNPAYYWPLSEPSGATTFGEVSGNSGPPLIAVDNPAFAASLTAGASTSIPGDPGSTGVSFAATGDTELLVGYSGPSRIAVGANTAAWGMTMSCWVNLDTGFLSPFGVVADSASEFPQFQLAGDVGNKMFLNLALDGTHFVNTPDSAAGYADGKWHHVVGTISQAANSMTITLWVDGANVSTSTVNVTTTFGSATPAFAMNRAWVQNGALIGGGGAAPGTYSGYALWTRALSTSEIADLWAAGGHGYSGETSGARVARQLGYGWTGATSIQTGLSIMGVSNLTAGTKLLASAQAVTTTENGNFWVDSLGQVTFDSRLARYLETSSVYTFGENYPTEYPYQDGIGFDLDPTLTYDTVTVANYQGITAVAANAATTKRFFPNSYSIQVNVEDNNEAIDHATYLLQQHDIPRQRIASIVLDPVGNPLLWPVVLSLEVGMRVTVVRRATGANNGAGLVMTGDYFVESISHDGIDLAAGRWLTTLLLSPVDLYQVGILDNSTYGRIATDGSVLVASITAAATSATVSTTGTSVAASTWTTSGGDVPFAATIGTETVTVTAVANLLTDTFTRTTANGWGTANTGQAWTATGGSAGNYATNGSVGQITNATVNVGRFVTAALGVADTETTLGITVPAVATGASMTAYWLARFADTSNYYRFGFAFNTNSTVDMSIAKVVAGVGTTLVSVTNIATYSAGTVVNLRAKILGTGVYANGWLSTGTEPPGWMLSSTDSALSAAGGVGVLNVLTTSNTNASPVFSFDNITTPTPQTFTITRPTDGSATTHSAGDAVALANSFILAF